MVACIVSSARFAMSWKEKICCLFLSGIPFVSMCDIGRKTIILGLMWRNGIGIIPNFASMPRTRNYMLPIAMKVLLPRTNGLVGKLCNLPQSYICFSKDRIWNNEVSIWVLDNAKN